MADPIHPVAHQQVARVDHDHRIPGPVGVDRAERFSKAMIAAALRAPMIDLAGANGGVEEEHNDPQPIPMKAPIIPKP